MTCLTGAFGIATVGIGPGAYNFRLALEAGRAKGRAMAGILDDELRLMEILSCS